MIYVPILSLSVGQSANLACPGVCVLDFDRPALPACQCVSVPVCQCASNYPNLTNYVGSYLPVRLLPLPPLPPLPACSLYYPDTLPACSLPCLLPCLLPRLPVP